MKRIKIQVFIIVLCFFATFFEARAASKEIHSDISVAVKFAYSLEKSMKENISSFKTKENLVDHYKKGFSAKLSKRLATQFWDVDNKKLNADAKPILVEPETVHILNVKKIRATAYFDSPKVLIRHWKQKKFTMLRLGLLNNHWTVYQMNTVNRIPGR